MESVLIGIGAAAIAGIATYLVGRRKTSGSISTSDAASLWAESNNLREEYKERAEKLETQLQAVNDQLQTVLGELTNWQTKGTKMAAKINELKGIIAKLRKENQRLLAEKQKGFYAKPRTA